MSDEQAQVWTVEDEIEAGIKPCPRCGGKAEVEDWLKGTIVCDGCGFFSGDDWDDLDEAIAWWNEQPLIDSLRAEIDQLRQELAAVQEWQPITEDAHAEICESHFVEAAGDWSTRFYSVQVSSTAIMFDSYNMIELPEDEYQIVRRVPKEQVSDG